MVLPFKKEAAYFYATDFLQDSGKQHSGKYPSMNPSFSAKSGLLWEATGIFSFWAVQKGIEYFYFPEQNSQFTHVCDGGIRGRSSIFQAGSSLNTGCTQSYALLFSVISWYFSMPESCHQGHIYVWASVTWEFSTSHHLWFLSSLGSWTGNFLSFI